jgi:hypothetical protein
MSSFNNFTNNSFNMNAGSNNSFSEYFKMCTNVAKQAMSTMSEIASDVAAGKNIKDAASDILAKAAENLTNKLKGSGKSIKRKKAFKKKIILKKQNIISENQHLIKSEFFEPSKVYTADNLNQLSIEWFKLLAKDSDLEHIFLNKNKKRNFSTTTNSETSHIISISEYKYLFAVLNFSLEITSLYSIKISSEIYKI